MDIHLVGLDLGEIQDIVEDAQQRAPRILNDRGHLLLLLVERGALEHLDNAQDAVERRADLVAHHGQEFRAGANRHFGQVFLLLVALAGDAVDEPGADGEGHAGHEDRHERPAPGIDREPGEPQPAQRADRERDLGQHRYPEERQRHAEESGKAKDGRLERNPAFPRFLAVEQLGQRQRVDHHAGHRSVVVSEQGRVGCAVPVLGREIGADYDDLVRKPLLREDLDQVDREGREGRHAAVCAAPVEQAGWLARRLDAGGRGQRRGETGSEAMRRLAAGEAPANGAVAVVLHQVDVRLDGLGQVIAQEFSLPEGQPVAQIGPSDDHGNLGLGHGLGEPGVLFRLGRLVDQDIHADSARPGGIQVFHDFGQEAPVDGRAIGKLGQGFLGYGEQHDVASLRGRRRERGHAQVGQPFLHEVEDLDAARQHEAPDHTGDPDHDQRPRQAPGQPGSHVTSGLPYPARTAHGRPPIHTAQPSTGAMETEPGVTGEPMLASHARWGPVTSAVRGCGRARGRPGFSTRP